MRVPVPGGSLKGAVTVLGSVPSATGPLLAFLVHKHKTIENITSVWKCVTQSTYLF